jgi:hypothetical protein
LLVQAPGALAQISVELRFDGQAFDPRVPPEFSCFNATLRHWASCQVEKGEGPSESERTGRRRLARVATKS